MNLPTLKNATVRFSNHGWLLTMSPDDHTPFFFDPFNNRTIKLPPIPNDCEYTTISFFHPPTSPDCLIIGILTASWKYNEMEIGVLKYGEDEWKNRVFEDAKHQFRVSLGPPILHGGKMYFLDIVGNVAMFDMSNDIEPLVIFPECLKKFRIRRNMNEHFLIKPKGEETIFAVFVVHDRRKVKVFRLTNKFEWKLVEDLGHQVFYVSDTSSLGYTSEDKSITNKIFFPKFYGDDLVYFSLETQKYHSLKGDYSSNDSYYDFKRLDFATWMVPIGADQQLSRELTWCPQADETTT